MLCMNEYIYQQHIMSQDTQKRISILFAKMFTVALSCLNKFAFPGLETLQSDSFTSSTPSFQGMQSR